MNYYEILGVERTAPEEKIKKAYHTMLKKYHPDNFQGDKEWACKRVCEINEAYAVLGDPIKKKQYDNLSEPNENARKDTVKQEKRYEDTASSHSESKWDSSESVQSGGFPWGIFILVCIIVCALYFLPNQMPEYFENLTNGIEDFLNTFR